MSRPGPALIVIQRLAVVALALSLTTCAPVGESRTPVQLHVPDDRLFAQLAEIEHVTDVSVQYSDNVGAGPLYDGDVLVDESADLLCVADQVNAILWQGRIANLAVNVLQGERYAGSPELGLDTSARSNPAEWEKFVERYGEHPAAGASPKPSPRPAPPAGGACG